MDSTRPRGLNELVEQQILRWQEEQRARAAKKAEATPERVPPVVTLSRQTWSRGTQMGKIVARKLGYEFWDQELVHSIAEQSGTSEKIVRALDEHTRGAIESLIAGVLTGESLSHREYVAQLMRVAHTIGKHGRAVIIGRGVQFILPPEAALRVRVVCPIDQRAGHLSRARSLPLDEALEQVEKTDAEREAFIESSFKRDVTDPTAYDLVINTGMLSLDQGADTIAAAYRAKFAAVLG
jgi:cytidylate kinase